MSRIVDVFSNFVNNPAIRMAYLSELGLYNRMSDDEYLKKKYKLIIGNELDLNNPKTFNEKLQWLKLYDRKPEYTMMVDKYKVREYVAKVIGEEYLIPLIGVWDSPDEINFDVLPNQFVLKCNHNSGTGMCICRDKSNLDIKRVKSELRKGLKENFYLGNREWVYKDVPRKIICEQYMENDEDSQGLTDYKLMCFNSKVKCSFTCTRRYSKEGVKVTFYDTNWKKMPFERHYPSEIYPIPKPKSYDKMVEMAEKLSKNIPFVRVDFYEIKGKPYFGEMTFYPGAGLEEFRPEEWDRKLGDWIELDV
jgi:hypothetical protein